MSLLLIKPDNSRLRIDMRLQSPHCAYYIIRCSPSLSFAARDITSLMLINLLYKALACACCAVSHPVNALLRVLQLRHEDVLVVVVGYLD